METTRRRLASVSRRLASTSFFSMSLASSISCSEVSSGTLPISRRYMRTGSSTVWSMVTSRRLRNSSSSAKSPRSSACSSMTSTPIAQQGVEELQLVGRQVGVLDQGAHLVEGERAPRSLALLEHSLQDLGGQFASSSAMSGPSLLGVEIGQTGAHRLQQPLQLEEMALRSLPCDSPPRPSPAARPIFATRYCSCRRRCSSSSTRRDRSAPWSASMTRRTNRRPAAESPCA